MRHHSNKRTLGRTQSGRTALLRGLALSLIEHGKIETTSAKAKELRPFVERIITDGKEGTIAARRRVATKLGEPHAEVIKKIFEVVAPKYAERKGGYTRIIKMGPTPAGRDEAVIELV